MLMCLEVVHTMICQVQWRCHLAYMLMMLWLSMQVLYTQMDEESSRKIWLFVVSVW